MTDGVRVATEADLAALPAIERAADELFAAVGIFDLPAPASVDELRAAAAVLVVDDPPVAFARLEVVDGRGHLEQLSVHPEAMRRGHGSALVVAALDWARRRGYDAVTLITFRDVPWNAPYYARFGFVGTGELTAGLRRLRDHEREVLGMDAKGARVVMRVELAPSRRDGRCR